MARYTVTRSITIVLDIEIEAESGPQAAAIARGIANDDPRWVSSTDEVDTYWANVDDEDDAGEDLAD